MQLSPGNQWIFQHPCPTAPASLTLNDEYNLTNVSPIEMQYERDVSMQAKIRIVRFDGESNEKIFFSDLATVGLNSAQQEALC